MGDATLSRVLGALFGTKGKLESVADGGDAPATARNTASRRDSADVFASFDEFGTVFVLGLKEYYDVLGGRSGRLAESIKLICESVMIECLEPGDVFACPDDDHLVFRFTDMDPRSAPQRAKGIVERIGTKLLGQHFLHSGQFSAALAMAEATCVVDADGRVSPRRMDAVLADVRAAADRGRAGGDAIGPRWEVLRHRGESTPAVEPRSAVTSWETLRLDTRRDRRLAGEAVKQPRIVAPVPKQRNGEG